MDWVKVTRRDETRVIQVLGFGVTLIRDFTVLQSHWGNHMMIASMPLWSNPEDYGLIGVGTELQQNITKHESCAYFMRYTAALATL